VTIAVSDSFGLLPYRILLSESNTDEWLQLRNSHGIGASESAAILGDSAWGTPRSIYDAKVSDKVEDITTDIMEFGHLAEPLIVSFMESHPERYGYLGQIVAAEGLLQSIKWPWLIGTLDREIITPEGIRVPLELKSINDFIAAEWRGGSEDEPDAYGTFVVPPKYLVQVLQQIAIKGAPFGYIAAWLGKGRVEVIRVERDEEYIQKYLVGLIGDFWNYNVIARTPPPLTLNDDLWKVYPGDSALPALDASDDILDTVGLFRVNGDDRRVGKKEMDQLKFDIVDFMGNATELRDPLSGEIIHTLRGQKTSRGTNYLLLEAKYPEAYEECVKPAGWTRVHRPTKVKVG